MLILAACGGEGGGDAAVPEGLATISGTLAYVVTECREKPRAASAHQKLQILHGEREVTVREFTIDRQPALGLCPLFATSRWGPTSIAGLLFQRLGVSRDGSAVVFEVSDDHSVLAPFLSHGLLPPEEEGIVPWGPIPRAGRSLRCALTAPACGSSRTPAALQRRRTVASALNCRGRTRRRYLRRGADGRTLRGQADCVGARSSPDRSLGRRADGKATDDFPVQAALRSRRICVPLCIRWPHRSRPTKGFLAPSNQIFAGSRGSPARIDGGERSLVLDAVAEQLTPEPTVVVREANGTYSGELPAPWAYGPHVP
jgi:hypothetical protein